MNSTLYKSHKSLLTRLTICLHVLIAIVLYAFSRLPSFDSSATPLLTSSWATPLLRWDVFHFAHIAKDGYTFEHEYAFFPGTPFLMRYGQKILTFSGLRVGDDLEGYVIAGTLLVATVSVGIVHTLYDLTLHLFGSPAFALLASLLSLLSSSPPTLRYASYTEPFFTYFSYKGMLYASKKKFIVASLMFMLAGTFRSNGIMLSGYIVWTMLAEPLAVHGTKFLSKGNIPNVFGCLILCSVPFVPFVLHQYSAYMTFCQNPDILSRPWCSGRLPSIYSYAQSAYWNVGLFRYWSLQQSPNIMLAMPVLILLFDASIKYIRRFLLPMLTNVLSGSSQKYPDRRMDIIYTLSIAPYAIHAFLLSTILLVAAHTQIALRFASAIPFTYWAAARLFFQQPQSPQEKDMEKSLRLAPKVTAARCWVYWSVLWGACSLVTWAVFLPPA